MTREEILIQRAIAGAVARRIDPHIARTVTKLKGIPFVVFIVTSKWTELNGKGAVA